MNKVSENPFKNRDYQSPLSPLVIIVAITVACYLTANVMAVKLINIYGITIFDAGTIIFPITYMLGDVLTEIWGFKTTKKVIWLTLVCEILFTFFAWIGTLLPFPSETTETANAYNSVFCFVPRITLASLIAFFCGELTNSWTMSKIKLKTGEKLLWVRTLGSSIFGYIVDTSLFVCIAFWGTIPNSDIFSMIGIQIVVKFLIEALGGTPLTYAVIYKLKKIYKYD